jgi:glutathione synthase/RimK-type ligase-like ATP-grasp enzyme
MILIITHKDDYTADFLIDKLNNQDVPYFRFNCEDMLNRGIEFRNGGNFSCELNGLSHFQSVWFRRTKLPVIESKLSSAEQNYLLMEYDGLLNNLLQNIDTPKWLSHPNAISIAENKLYQLKIAQQVGFNLPETLVTSSKQQILDFAKKCNNEIIIKPLRSGRVKENDSIRLIYTNKVNTDHLAKIDSYDITPCIFQEYIPKEYEIRVTIINQTVYAAKVNSQEKESTKTDWRKEKLTFFEYTLPTNLEEQCKALVSKMGLSFGAIDLIKSTDGSYYFLENNPNGQWAWIETDTQLPISNSIIHFLTT